MMQPMDIVFPLLHASQVAAGGAEACIPGWVVGILCAGYGPLGTFIWYQSKVKDEQARRSAEEMAKRNDVLTEYLLKERAG